MVDPTKTLRHELLDDAGPFTDLPTAQAAIDAWVYAYNHSRPHQSLDMAVPAKLFRPNDPTPFGVLTPATADTTRPSPLAVGDPPTASAQTGTPAVLLAQSAPAVEFDTVISPSGVLSVLPAVQRHRLGTARAGQRAHVWADELSIHICIDGELIKTAPSRLTAADLATLKLRGAQPAGPAPQPRPAGSAALQSTGQP